MATAWNSCIPGRASPVLKHKALKAPRRHCQPHHTTSTPCRHRSPSASQKAPPAPTRVQGPLGQGPLLRPPCPQSAESGGGRMHGRKAACIPESCGTQSTWAPPQWRGVPVQSPGCLIPPPRLAPASAAGLPRTHPPPRTSRSSRGQIHQAPYLTPAGGSCNSVTRAGGGSPSCSAETRPCSSEAGLLSGRAGGQAATRAGPLQSPCQELGVSLEPFSYWLVGRAALPAQRPPPVQTLACCQTSGTTKPAHYHFPRQDPAVLPAATPPDTPLALGGGSSQKRECPTEVAGLVSLEL